MSNTKNTEEPQGSHDAQESRKTRDSEETNKPTENNRTTRRPSPMELLREARGQLAELTGMEAESVSSFERTDDGWSLEVEVLELERVPDTMSLMASYRVELDPDGQLTGYRRVGRYERGRADPHRPGGR
ncbi:gas vesicle protein [Streptomyces sp. NPDC093250]|uniref:gas vesicle protein GvpO n=1 Tax=unclassified Streptomyces TaxID=2593676 RepID=UPI0033CF4400